MSGRFLSVIVPAAGSATRMGGEKQRLTLCGLPVLVRTLLALQNTPSVNEIIVVARPGDVEDFAAWAPRYGISKLKAVVVGGDTR
ncbi:MAG: 2-C-methyl-D-erythritol 4-phosphate cytidylyltransferase, partial [Clostridia bacterium]|nr:2-C-methyl-D-erythritol 4-phosphate cytidylyltransferase [Clostridia bacterium]